jgi:hypothetical protein
MPRLDYYARRWQGEEMVAHVGELHFAVYGEAEFSSLGIRPEGTDGNVRVLLHLPEFRDLSPFTVPNARGLLLNSPQ